MSITPRRVLRWESLTSEQKIELLRQDSDDVRQTLARHNAELETIATLRSSVDDLKSRTERLETRKPRIWNGSLTLLSHHIDEEKRAFYTVQEIPPGTRVFASCALTFVRTAIDIDRQGIQTQGAAGVVIKRWTWYMDDGRVQSEEPPSTHDWSKTNIVVDNCSSVTFELFAAGAWAFGSYSVIEI
jgi:hypothetical protein